MRGRQLSSDSPTASALVTFAASYGFYLALGSPTDPFDLVTGALTAGVVAAAFSGVAFRESPTLGRTGGRLLRAVAFLPYLLWTVLKANVALAAVLLDPRLPIDPTVVELDAGTETDFERTVLASAVTLTPGTVVLDADGGRMTVHALTPASAESLREGSLQRAVGFLLGDYRQSRQDRADPDEGPDPDGGLDPNGGPR